MLDANINVILPNITCEIGTENVNTVLKNFMYFYFIFQKR